MFSCWAVVAAVLERGWGRRGGVRLMGRKGFMGRSEMDGWAKGAMFDTKE